MKILHLVGARPNFMKIAPIMRSMGQSPHPFDQLLVHSGQHYDENMSRVFFEELGLPQPHLNLEVGSGSHAWQTAQVMERLEPVLNGHRPDWLVVVGDVNSTLAGALVASKLGIRVAHVEAGLRSYDRSMPEEINRLLTDQISDLLFTHSREADRNLLREGISREKIHFVGNVMIDTLVRLMPAAESRWPALRRAYALERFLLVTLHRPANVDHPETLAGIMAALEQISAEVQVLFPVHPRTRQALLEGGWSSAAGGVRLAEPLGYLDFLALQAHANLVLTDSGGVQEETTYLGVPCLTVRPNTERPVTVTNGTNRLVSNEPAALAAAIRDRLGAGKQPVQPPELWDGQVAERMVGVMLGLA